MYDDNGNVGDIQDWSAVLIDLLWRKSLSKLHERQFKQSIRLLQVLVVDQSPELRNIIVNLALNKQIGISAEKFDRFLRILPSFSCSSIADSALAIIEAQSSDMLWETMLLCAQLKDDRIVEALIALLKDKRGWVRLGAAHALRSIGDKRAIEPLLLLLQDERDDVRWTVVNALARFGDDQILEPLLNILDDPCQTVRMFAIEALGSIRSPRAIEPFLALLDDPLAESQLVLALGIPGAEQAVEPLIARLGSSDRLVRLDAVIALGTIGDLRAVEPLVTIFDHQDSDTQVFIIDILEQLGALEAIKSLSLQTSEDNYLRLRGVMILARLGEQKSIPQLVALLQDSDERVRDAAASALGTLR